MFKAPKPFLVVLLVLLSFVALAQNTVVEQATDILLRNSSTNSVALKVVKPGNLQVPYVTLGTQTSTVFSVSSTGLVTAAAFSGDGSQLTGISGGGGSNFDPARFYTNASSRVAINTTNVALFGSTTNFGDIRISDGRMVLTNTGTSAAIEVDASGSVNTTINNGDFNVIFNSGQGINFGASSSFITLTNFTAVIFTSPMVSIADTSVPLERVHSKAIDLYDLGAGPDPVTQGIYGDASGNVVVAGGLVAPSLDIQGGAITLDASGNATFNGKLIVTTGVVAPPATASSTGTAGTITWDSGFIYVCVAANTWKRVAIATW